MLGWLPPWMRWAFGLLVAVLAIWWFVLPQFDEAHDALGLIADVDPFLVVASGSLVAAAYVAQAQMTRSVIPRRERPGLLDMVRVELASGAISHTVPGGTAAGTALGFRLLTRSGVSGTSAGFALGVRGVGSALVLNVALWIALAVWVPMNGLHANFGVAAGVGAFALALLGILAVVVLRAHDRLTETIGRVLGAIPGLDVEEVHSAVENFVEQLHDLLTDVPLTLRISGWAALHWLAEAASLWIILSAFGWSGGPLAVFVAFGVVNVLAVVPVTPRGLGIVEAVLIPMLIALGAPGQVAAVGVVAWRLLSFWAPIPVGTISYVSVRIREPDVGEDVPERRRLAVEELAAARRSRSGRDEADGSAARPRVDEHGRRAIPSGPDDRQSQTDEWPAATRGRLGREEPMESPSDHAHDLDGADHPIGASETHISRLFFAPDRVYKLLKPLAMEFLDHSTVERRLAAVTAELELNRRIAPDVYLGMSDLREDDRVVDRMLIMRRLPDERRLSNLVDEPDFDDHLRQIAHRVATFHAAAPPVQERYTMTTASGLLSLWESSFDDIEPSVGSVIDADEFDRVRLLARTYLEHSEQLFDDRRRQGLMRDGHGDLTADDIFMIDDGPRILDCLAFDDDYRISDVLADVAFLAMDLEGLGGPDQALHFLTSYCEFVDENHPSSLADHYIAYRAHVRAKVALLRHRQGDQAAAEIAARRHQQARDHLERARRRLVLVGGGPGSGKTTVARGLADRFNWSVIDSDTYRKDLRGIDYHDHDVERHPHLYDEQTTAATYTGLIERAGALLEAGESVIIDATWKDSDHRSLARELAERRGAELVELECRLDPQIARQRISRRRDGADDASDASPDLVDEMARHRDPWTSAGGIDTDRPIDEVVEAAIEQVLESRAATA